MAKTKTPHKHAEVIKAWADGATIETKWGCGTWEEIERPSFSNCYEYRVKPEPKKLKYRVALLSDGKDVWTTTEDCGDDPVGEFEYFVRYLTDWIEVEV
jgi:hypothetical protein